MVTKYGMDAKVGQRTYAARTLTAEEFAPLRPAPVQEMEPLSWL